VGTATERITKVACRGGDGGAQTPGGAAQKSTPKEKSPAQLRA